MEDEFEKLKEDMRNLPNLAWDNGKKQERMAVELIEKYEPKLKAQILKEFLSDEELERLEFLTSQNAQDIKLNAKIAKRRIDLMKV